MCEYSAIHSRTVCPELETQSSSTTAQGTGDLSMMHEGGEVSRDGKIGEVGHLSGGIDDS